MTPCARGCCWSPFSCARDRFCRCHWEEKKPTGQSGAAGIHRDPTANQAIKNVMRTKRGRRSD